MFKLMLALKWNCHVSDWNYRYLQIFFLLLVSFKCVKNLTFKEKSICGSVFLIYKLNPSPKIRFFNALCVTNPFLKWKNVFLLRINAFLLLLYYHKILDIKQRKIHHLHSFFSPFSPCNTFVLWQERLRRHRNF